MNMPMALSQRSGGVMLSRVSPGGCSCNGGQEVHVYATNLNCALKYECVFGSVRTPAWFAAEGVLKCSVPLLNPGFVQLSVHNAARQSPSRNTLPFEVRSKSGEQVGTSMDVAGGGAVATLGPGGMAVDTVSSDPVFKRLRPGQRQPDMAQQSGTEWMEAAGPRFNAADAASSGAARMDTVGSAEGSSSLPATSSMSSSFLQGSQMPPVTAGAASGSDYATNSQDIVEPSQETSGTQDVDMDSGGGHAMEPEHERSGHANNVADMEAGSTPRNPPPQTSVASPCRTRADAPVVKLSVKLIDTYNHINKVYYEKKKKSKYDDKNWDLIVTHGDMLDSDRYELIKVIGSGSFGQVVKARDRVDNVEVAIKIIKNKPAFYKQAKTEVELLEFLNSREDAARREDIMRTSQGGRSSARDPNIVRLKHHFVHRNHMCLVFELLSYNLYDLLRLTKFRGVSLNLIRKFAKQIITSLRVLSDSNIIHCDLKPENILLRHPKRSAIKLIDFGSSCRDKKTVYTYIQSRYYRAPEVILGTRYDVAIDMWSLGCTLVEMHTGEPLFGGVDEADQMKKIVETLGPVPPSLSQRADAKKRDMIPRSQRQVRALSQVVAEAKKRNKDKDEHTDHDYELFIELIQLMLTYEPADRVKPSEALAHPFLHGLSPRSPHPAGGNSGSVGGCHTVSDSSSARAPPSTAPHTDQRQISNPTQMSPRSDDDARTSPMRSD